MKYYIFHDFEDDSYYVVNNRSKECEEYFCKKYIKE